MSVMGAVAEALVDNLNGQSWQLPAKATRGWRPIEDRDFADQWTIVVVPTRKRSARLSRERSAHEVTVEITVQRAHDGRSGETDPVLREDPIVELAEQIEEHAINTTLWIAGKAATPVNGTDTEISRERLDEGIVAVRIEMTFKVIL